MNNDPAFPIPENHEWTGMSLRDYFAAKVMQGTIAHMQEGDEFSLCNAEWCYRIADMMLKARGST